jgi:hypothetical protein
LSTHFVGPDIWLTKERAASAILLFGDTENASLAHQWPVD